MVRHVPRTPSDAPDLVPVREVISDNIWRAMVDVSAELTRLGVHHALIGGLAVGAHGYPRATKDVDFIVDDSGWKETDSGLVVMRVGLPIRAHGVEIDHLAIPPDEQHLATAITGAVVSEGVPVAPVTDVIYLKLLSPRRRDHDDVIELVERGGVDPAAVDAYLDEVNATEAVRRRWAAVMATTYEE